MARFALIAWMLTATNLLAAAADGLSPQERYDRAIEEFQKGEQYKDAGKIAMQVGLCIVAFGVVGGACKTAVKGLTIREGRTLVGAPAYVIAAILAAIGIGIAIFGVYVLPNVLP